MKQAMVVVAIVLLMVGFVFIVSGYVQRDNLLGPNGNGDDDHYPPEVTPPDTTPPPNTPPESLPIWWREGSKPLTTIQIFGYTVSVLEVVGVLLCIVGAVIFITGGRL